MTAYRMRLGSARLLAATAALCVATGEAAAQTGKLPMDAFAMEPSIDNVRVSPDGKHLAMLMTLAKDGKGILTIYKTDNLKAKPVRVSPGDTRFTSFFWGNDERIVVEVRKFQEIRRADFKMRTKYLYRLFSIDVEGKKWVELPDRNTRIQNPTLRTYIQVAPAQLQSRLRDDEDHILISFDREARFVPDFYRININTGHMAPVVRGNPRFSDYISDRRGDLRFATEFDLGKFEAIFFMRQGNGELWEEIYRFGVEDRTSFDIVGDYLDEPDKILVAAHNGRDNVALWSFDTKAKKIDKLVFARPNVDVSAIVTSTKPGQEHKLAGYLYTEDIPRVEWVDEEEKALNANLDAVLPGTYNRITSRSRDNRYIVVYAQGPKEPGAYYLLMNGTKLLFLGRNLPLLTKDVLADVKMIRYKARDGLEIPAYLTIPKGKPPFPAIVLPHGGPWARDTMQFDLWAQMLAYHGYLVLQPQFRGSFGFGMKLWRAGDAQWGLAMQNDLEDGMAHLISQGLTTKDRLAIFGWSYGGYAAMVATVRQPNIFQCAIAGAGVSDITVLRAGLSGSSVLRRIQRPTINGVSPLQHVAKANVPVLVIHGDEDERVDIDQSEKFVSGLKRYGKPHKFLVLKDANHFYGTIHYEHWMKMFPAMIDFLRKDCGPGGL